MRTDRQSERQTDSRYDEANSRFFATLRTRQKQHSFNEQNLPDITTHSGHITYIEILLNVLLLLCILIDIYALFCIFFGNWHSPATLNEGFPCCFLSCKANARVYLTKTGQGPHSS